MWRVLNRSYDQVPISETLGSIVNNIRRKSKAVTAVQSTSLANKQRRSVQQERSMRNPREVELTPDLQPRPAPGATEMSELNLGAAPGEGGEEEEEEEVK